MSRNGALIILGAVLLIIMGLTLMGAF